MESVENDNQVTLEINTPEKKPKPTKGNKAQEQIIPFAEPSSSSPGTSSNV